jgi:hypothetical protein
MMAEPIDWSTDPYQAFEQLAAAEIDRQRDQVATYQAQAKRLMEGDQPTQVTAGEPSDE